MSQSFEEWIASQSGAYYVSDVAEATVTTGSLSAFEWTLYGEGTQQYPLVTQVREPSTPTNVGFYVKDSGDGFVTFGLQETDSGGHNAGEVSAGLEVIFIPVRGLPS